jgi:hypothetical protein
MISSLKDTIQAKIFALYTRRLTKASKKSAINHQHSIPVGIGLLYTHDPANPEKTDAVLQVVKKLQAGGKQVQVLCYVPDNKSTEINTPFDTVTKEDINLLGRSQNAPLNSFLKSPFAYLYHLDLVSDVVLDYIVAKCIAHCKIGNYLAGREALFELMFKDLAQPEEKVFFDSLISKMFSYTQLLKV